MILYGTDNPAVVSSHEQPPPLRPRASARCGIDCFTAGNAPGVAGVGAGRCEPARLRRAGHGRLGAARAVWTSRVSWRVSRTLAGPMREVSRPWQQAMTWSITAV